MNPTQALISALERDLGGVAVVLCPDLALRDSLINEVEGLAASDAQPFRTSFLDDVIDAPHRMALVIPDNEEAIVQEFDGRRDQLLEPPRTQPVVLFLIRNGDGQAALARSPSLASWVRGNDVDPDELAEVDVPADRERFEAKTGRSVEEWLTSWRAGEVPRNGETFSLAYWAALLERR